MKHVKQGWVGKTLIVVHLWTTKQFCGDGLNFKKSVKSGRHIMLEPSG